MGTEEADIGRTRSDGHVAFCASSAKESDLGPANGSRNSETLHNISIRVNTMDRYIGARQVTDSSAASPRKPARFLMTHCDVSYTTMIFDGCSEAKIRQ